MLIGGILFGLAIWLAVEAIIRFVQFRRGQLPPMTLGRLPAD